MEKYGTGPYVTMTGKQPAKKTDYRGASRNGEAKEMESLVCWLTLAQESISGQNLIA